MYEKDSQSCWTSNSTHSRRPEIQWGQWFSTKIIGRGTVWSIARPMFMILLRMSHKLIHSPGGFHLNRREEYWNSYTLPLVLVLHCHSTTGGCLHMRYIGMCCMSFIDIFRCYPSKGSSNRSRFVFVWFIGYTLYRFSAWMRLLHHLIYMHRSMHTRLQIVHYYPYRPPVNRIVTSLGLLMILQLWIVHRLQWMKVWL